MNIGISILVIVILQFVAAEHESKSEYSSMDSYNNFENSRDDPQTFSDSHEYDYEEEDNKHDENENDDAGEEDREYDENEDDDAGEEDREDDDSAEEDSKNDRNQDDDYGEEDSENYEYEDDDYGEEAGKYPGNQDDDSDEDTCNKCGGSLVDKGGRVINGKAVKPMNKYPWIVPVVINQKIRCGGAIISKKYILTASHCVYLLKGSSNMKCKRQKSKKNCYYNAKNISIKLLGNKKFGKVVKIKKIITHPKFDKMKIINDIALLELTESLKCKKTMFPICIPTNKEVYKEGQKIIVAGWGKTADSQPDGTTSDVLKEGVMKEISSKKCLRPGLPKDTVKQYHCVVGTKQTSCQGDSGSSMFAKHKKRYYTLGVISHGKTKHCHITWPVTNAKTLYFLDWIKQHVKDLPKIS